MSTAHHLTRLERRRIKRRQTEQQKKRGRNYPQSFTLPNRKSDLKTVAEEKEAIEQTTEEKLSIYKQLLPGLLKKLSGIADPRNPRKIKHCMTVMMLYGILMFVFHMPSRRKTNQEMTTPQLLANLQAVFPELKAMPHQDTLCRLLEKIAVDQIEVVYIEMLKSLIRKKKFKDLLYNKRYLVAIDGTQKYVMDQCWDERYLRRKIRNKDGEYHHYAYVLEAVLIFSNGMVLPLISEFLENDGELEAIESDEEWKQDCELKAFYRLSKRLKHIFPKLSLTLLLDGLYANGPVMSICFKHKWKFMIVLKEKSLPLLWQDAEGLVRLDKEKTNSLKQNWQGRGQAFLWANDLEYDYNLGRQKKRITVHVVTCRENWEKNDKNGVLVREKAFHAWISSDRITKNNVHGHCNLAARKRWLHENNILKEKHQGYRYEHIFSHDFDAMRGYHYLMHISRMLNEMAIHSIYLTEHVKAVGLQAFISTFRAAMTHRELDRKMLVRLSQSPGQLRLVQEDNWKTSCPAA